MLPADVDLSGVGPRGVDARIEGVDASRAAPSIESAAATSAARASRSAPATASAATAVDGCVPLMSASPSFGPSVTGDSPARRERLPSAAHRRIVTHPGVALADEHERQVGERGEVAARADRSAARHARVDAAVEEVEQPLERRAADAGEALGQHVGAERHRRTHGPNRQRIADAGGVAAQQVDLQRAERIAGMAVSASAPNPVLMP